MTPKYDIQSDAFMADALIELGITQSFVGTPVPAQKVSMNSTTMSVLNQLIEEPTLSKQIVISAGGTIKVRSFIETIPLDYDPVIVDWAARVVTNGGAAPSANTKAALTTFYQGLVSNGLASKMKALNCFVPDNLIACITPLYKSASIGNDPWTNGNFVDGDLTANGLAGNASNKYLDTGAVPTASYPNGCWSTSSNGGLSLYVHTSTTSPSREIGSRDGNNYEINLLTNYGGTTYFDSYTDNGTGRVSGTPIGGNGAGFTSGNRTAATSSYIYGANSITSSILTIAGPSGLPAGLPPMQAIYVFAANFGGSPAAYSDKRISFVAIHDGLTLSESQTLFNLVQAMRQSLGGGYV